MSVITYIGKFFKGSTPLSKVDDLEVADNIPYEIDDDLETIDLEFVKTVRKTIKYLSVNGTDIPSVVNSQVMGIIGKKITIQSRIPDQPDVNIRIESLIKGFSKLDEFEVTGRWHFDGFLRAIVEFSCKEGGVLIRHHYNSKWKYGYRPELISVSEIDYSFNEPSKNIINGIEKDKYGKITAIYLYDNNDRLKSHRVSYDDLSFYSHIWISISQYTSVSKLTSILPSVDLLDRYTDSELKSAIKSADDGKYWKSSIFDDILSISKNIKSTSDQQLQLSEVMKKISNSGVKPSGLTPIPLGDDVIVEGKNNHSVYDVLTKNSQLKIGSAVGISSQFVYQDPSQSNYSAIKAMLAFSETSWGIEFDDLASKVIDPIMDKFINSCHLKGLLNISDFIQKPDYYINLQYYRVLNIDIEPSKTASANKINLENGTHSVRELAARRGRDIEDIHREIIEDELAFTKMRQEMYDKEGIPVPIDDTTKTNNKVNTNEN